MFKNTSESMKNNSGTSVTPHVDKPKLSAVTSHSKKLQALIPSHSVPQPREFNVVTHRNCTLHYEREISHLKTTYKNLFDSITSNQAHAKLHDLIYENAQLRARVFENTSESMKNNLGMSVTPHVDKPKLSAITPHSKKLQASARVFENTSESMKNNLGMSVTPHVDKPKLSAVTPHSKKLQAIPSHSVPQPREFNIVTHRNVIAPRMFKINPSQTFRVDLVPNKQSNANIRTNPITNFQRHVTFKENVSSDTVNASSTGLVHTARTRRPQPKGNTRNARVPSASKSSEVKKNVTMEDHRRTLLLSKNQKTMSYEFASKETNGPNDDKACTSNPQEPMRKCFQIQLCFLAGTVRSGNDHIAAILGYGDLKWENITITRVYFVDGLGHNLFSVGEFCDANLEVAFRTNTCFIRDLDGVDLLKGNRSTNLYTINLYDMASASPLCLMARATPTESWLWHQ
nr:integrase, catalytic region, zinc finger, CCHC-type, peptidase aspartic, catalytic [Tanacetum cinerariifolium]